MKTEYIILKETVLTNNCPECYATDSLHLTFKQKKTSSKFMIKTKSQVLEDMVCNTCETHIFPGRYTDDIERVYNYHKKTITPHASSIRFTGAFYIIILVVLIVAIIISIYLFYPEILDNLS